MTKSLHLAIVDPVGCKAGLDHYDRELALAFGKLNCTVDIYSNFSDSENEFRVFPFRFWRNPLLIPTLILIYRRLIKRCLANSTDIIICHLFHANKIDLWFLEKCNQAGLKTAVILHDVESHLAKADNDIKLRECLDLAGHIFIHSEFSAKVLNEKFTDQFASKVSLIPHGHFLSVRTSVSRQQAFQRLKLSPERRYVMFFGMIKPTKGLDVLITAMKNQKADLIIAGRLRKQSFSYFENLIHENNLKNRVHRFVRFISNEERDLFFKVADVIVLPYEKVYQSGVLLMAMSYGLPVIVSDLDSFKEIVRDSENGQMFQGGDAKELAEKIHTVLADTVKSEAMAKTALDEMRLHHDWQKIAEQMKGVLA